MTVSEKLERFTFNPEDATISQCMFCKHNIPGTFGCNAFPEEIPLPIRTNEHNHKEPYPNDNGIRFELRDDLPEEAKEVF